MSIVEAIDVRIEGVEEEIRELEEQLDQKRSARERLQGLRKEAEPLDGEGGGLPAPAPSPAPAPPAQKPPTGRPAGSEIPSPEASGAIDERVKAIAALLQEHPDGLAASEIRDKLHLSANQFRALRPALAEAVDREGTGRATVYFAKKRAPAAAPKPSPPPARQPTPPPPAEPPADRPSSAEKEAHNALRARIRQAVLDLVADSEPISGEEIATMILEQIPEAERNDVVQVRMKLSREERLIEEVAAGFRIVARRDGPVTQVERDVVACLGSGRTAREVAANVDSVRDAVAARGVLEGLARRNVVARREGSDPIVYEAAAAEKAA